MSSPTLLHLDASPRGARSHSRTVALEFAKAWLAARPGSTVQTLDLGVNPPPFVTEPWVEGAFTAPAGHSPGAKKAIAVSDAYVAQLLGAGHLLISTPMYNLSVPAALKAWIDQIVRFGLTFEKGPDGFRGLVKGVAATVVIASGSDFRPDTPAGGYNFVVPYLRAILGFIGITDVRFIHVHSLNVDGEARRRILADAEAEARGLAA